MLSLKTKELSSARDVIQSVCREIRFSFSRTWLIHTKRLTGCEFCNRCSVLLDARVVEFEDGVYLSLARFAAAAHAGSVRGEPGPHQRRLRIDHVHSGVKRCRSVRDRSRLWKVG